MSSSNVFKSLSFFLFVVVLFQVSTVSARFVSNYSINLPEVDEDWFIFPYVLWYKNEVYVLRPNFTNFVLVKDNKNGEVTKIANASVPDLRCGNTIFFDDSRVIDDYIVATFECDPSGSSDDYKFYVISFDLISGRFNYSVFFDVVELIVVSNDLTVLALTSNSSLTFRVFDVPTLSLGKLLNTFPKEYPSKYFVTEKGSIWMRMASNNSVSLQEISVPGFKLMNKIERYFDWDVSQPDEKIFINSYDGSAIWVANVNDVNKTKLLFNVTGVNFWSEPAFRGRFGVDTTKFLFGCAIGTKVTQPIYQISVTTGKYAVGQVESGYGPHVMTGQDTSHSFVNPGSNQIAIGYIAKSGWSVMIATYDDQF